MKNRILQVLALVGFSAILTTIAYCSSWEQVEIKTLEPEPIQSQITYELVIEEPDPIEIAIQEMQTKMDEINNIEDELEWFLAYKSIVNEYKDILDPPETIYDYFTYDELDLLFRVVQAEVGDEWEFIHKTNVANVIFNRLYSEERDFKEQDTLSKVLVADQFCTIRSGRYKKVEVSEMTILACEYAFEIVDTTNGCLFFDNNGAQKDDYIFTFHDGAHYLYRLGGDKNMEQNKIKINLGTVDKVKNFINVARRFMSDIDVMTDRACIDGKSILGLYALDLSQNTYVRIISDDKEEISKFNAAMEEFR